ncbi:hypothetical protein GDO78_008586 [Eleutherodactylus coqui]|uniref:Uncharacterized protein n=1 Tax=Eleutherodactylus coqui TaxID=57060 RepID=A0A8J6FF13_ELECQ|nr:hypothetical protein GDO78_008586 [Eleutherodactylus coqui]
MHYSVVVFSFFFWHFTPYTYIYIAVFCVCGFSNRKMLFSPGVVRRLFYKSKTKKPAKMRDIHGVFRSIKKKLQKTA